jgi:hypothetical protein
MQALHEVAILGPKHIEQPIGQHQQPSHTKGGRIPPDDFPLILVNTLELSAQASGSQIFQALGDR